MTDLAANVSSEQLVVSWRAPSDEEITGYTVELKDLTGSQKLVTATTTTFDTLKPGKKYTVVVRAMINTFASEAVETVFYTSKSVSSLMLRDVFRGFAFLFQQLMA